ncbi:MAG TPA: hypothetical protein ENN80_02740 [Candidatus Hydrogenedentes bacterium]|nr:hypothetical protein [Candidatus Hydrogenedentota bacterium]
MRVFHLTCGRCGHASRLPIGAASIATACGQCGTAVRIELFPALLREAPSGSAGHQLVLDNESSCFCHPQKRATAVCDRCGRFLCDLCDIEMNDEHLCPACIETGVKKGELKRLRAEYFYYDELALILAIVPLMLFWVTLVTAPVALFIAIRHWNAPMSAVPRGKTTLVAAIVLASLELLGWAAAGAVLLGL